MCCDAGFLVHGMSSADGGSSVIKDEDNGCVNSSSSCRQRVTRRLLRSAVRDRDLLTLRRMLADIGLSDDSALSGCSLLAYAARCGHLDIVEALVDMPGCHVDRVDRTKRSALDEAIGAWSATALDTGGRPRLHDRGKRYRIVRRLLTAGTRSLSRPALGAVLSSALDSANGQYFITKLVKVK